MNFGDLIKKDFNYDVYFKINVCWVDALWESVYSLYIEKNRWSIEFSAASVAAKDNSRHYMALFVVPSGKKDYE